MSNTSHTHLDEWLSEYPQQRIYIMRRRAYFEQHPPPKGDTTPEWATILTSLGPEFGTSTGTQSSNNSTDSPWEPPF